MKSRDIIIMAGLNLLALSAVVFLVLINYRQVESIKGVGDKIASLNNERQNWQELRRLAAGLREDKIKIDEYVVNNTNTDIFLEHLEVIAKQSGVVMSVTSAGAGNQLAVTLAIKGPYENIAHYIELLATMHYLVMINRVNLQFVPGTKREWVGDINISLLSYQP